MRRTSVSLPTKHVAHDPHEKPARYGYGGQNNQGIFANLKAVWMSQAQKARWVKTAAIVCVLLGFFYWLSPRGVDMYNGGSYIYYRPSCIIIMYAFTGRGADFSR